MKFPSELYRKYALVASPSQVEDFAKCSRQWWLRRVVHEPYEEQTDRFAFGGVLHAAAALAAVGSDPFPEGWAGGIPAHQAAAIRALVSRHARPRPNCEVEKPAILEVSAGHCAMAMVCDLVCPDGVEDHKAVLKADRIPPQEALAGHLPLLAYSKWWLTEHPDAGEVRAQLNYFALDSLEYRELSILRSRAEVEAAWQQRVLPILREMWALRKSPLKRDDWEAIEAPSDPAACRWCPYAGRVCLF